MSVSLYFFILFFFFNDTATTEIYTLSLHDALPISQHDLCQRLVHAQCGGHHAARSEEHTSELQSRENLVCRLLLEKKKKGGKRIVNEKVKEEKRVGLGKRTVD